MLDLKFVMRRLPKVMVKIVARYAVCGGNVFHLVCDLKISADNGVYDKTGPIIGKFDGSYVSSYLALVVDQKKSSDILFQCQKY